MNSDSGSRLIPPARYYYRRGAGHARDTHRGGVRVRCRPRGVLPRPGDAPADGNRARGGDPAARRPWRDRAARAAHRPGDGRAPVSWRVARRVTRLAVALLVAVHGVAGAQDLVCDPGDTRVDDIDFRGNQTFSDAELASAIATTPSSFWRRADLPFFGATRCLDRAEFPRDVLRLRLFYRQRGFYRTRVDTVITPNGPGRIDISFDIAEGPPVLIDSMRVMGLESVRDGARLARQLEEMQGRRFDRQRVAGSDERHPRSAA